MGGDKVQVSRQSQQLDGKTRSTNEVKLSRRGRFKLGTFYSSSVFPATEHSV